MTAFDRIEARMPELFDELAGAAVPDYFDDMLRQSAQVRQRPARSARERWLPMGVIARPLPFRPVPWRPIVIVALVATLAVATLVYVGSQPRLVPPPFGLAANGALAIGTADGDIVTVDPVTGTTAPLITGPSIDSHPYFSNDGLRLIFDRGQIAPFGHDRGSDRRDAALIPGSDLHLRTLWVAEADGTNGHEIASGLGVDWFEWNPNSELAVLVSETGGVYIVNVLDGTRTLLRLELEVWSASWRPDHEQIIVTDSDGGFWVVNADGSGTPRRIDARPAENSVPTISPDGRLLAYATSDWAQIRVVDIDAGNDHAITDGEADGSLWGSPQFSPDGTSIGAHRLVGSDPAISSLNIIAADGQAPPIPIGQASKDRLETWAFSPDGTSLLATYVALDGEGTLTRRTTFMFDTITGKGDEVPFVAINGSSWQPLVR